MLMFLVCVVLVPSLVMAEVDVKVRVNIPLPPPIVFLAPPMVVVIPETYVYTVPDVDAEIFFYGGWWWRPWEGRWYRSRYYDRGWGHYSRVPSFYTHVPPGWRKDYHERRWKGHEWEQHRIPHREMEKNWRGWERKKHWEKEHNWGVKGLESRKHLPKPGKQPQYRDKRQGPPAKKAGPPAKGKHDKERRDRDRDKEGRR